jgi:hypothetical protein
MRKKEISSGKHRVLYRRPDLNSWWRKIDIVVVIFTNVSQRGWKYLFKGGFSSYIETSLCNTYTFFFFFSSYYVSLSSKPSQKILLIVDNAKLGSKRLFVFLLHRFECTYYGGTHTKKICQNFWAHYATTLYVWKFEFNTLEKWQFV